jgi:AmmeMemoRadiSam system protein A
MSLFGLDDKKNLLIVARSAIRAELFKEEPIIRPKTLSPVVTEKRGCFVTLHKSGELRGCIGAIEPVKPLISCVEENAVNAAFNDPRFPGVTGEEIDILDIEISILSVPKTLKVSSIDELKEKIKPRFHGVILSRGWKKATFLPQVWEQLPNTETFLANLCMKAGMGRGCWKDPETEIKVYTAQYFSEADTFKYH